MELNRNDLKPVFHFARDAHQEQAEVVQYFWCLHLDEKEQIKTICCSQSPAVICRFAAQNGLMESNSPYLMCWVILSYIYRYICIYHPAI